ncbi:MAG: alpha/beta hydrolase [Thermoleophilia bacterium]|nr:alpha/beta hydrolase [Thermoleophilia bacterium]
MAPELPAPAGVRHGFHDLPTGVQVHVAETGPQDGPPVLLLHGWPQHFLMWRGVWPALAGSHRVVMPDLRGHGWSGWPADGDFRKARLADDVVALLDVLEIPRAHVIGHDWGAWTALLLGLGHAERVRTLLAVSIVHPWQPTSLAARNAWRMAYQVPLATPWVGERLVRREGFIRRVIRSGFRDRSAWDEDAARSFEDVMRTPQGARTSHRMYRSFLMSDFPGGLAGGAFKGGRFTMPARLLIGEHDPLGAHLVKGFERHGVDAAWEVVPGAGHFLPEERPQVVSERALALLAAAG